MIKSFNCWKTRFIEIIHTCTHYLTEIPFHLLLKLSKFHYWKFSNLYLDFFTFILTQKWLFLAYPVNEYWFFLKAIYYLLICWQLIVIGQQAFCIFLFFFSYWKDKGWQVTKFVYSMYSAYYYRERTYRKWEKERR